VIDTHKMVTRFIAVFAIMFGAVTVTAGGSALFLKSAQEMAGNAVPFVLWFNFLAGFFYLLAGVGIWSRQRWAAQLSVMIGGLTVLVFGAFGIHIFTGGLYEPRTVAAMSLRSLVWLGIAYQQRALLKWVP